MTFLTLNALHKHYGSVAALDGVDLAVERGSRTAIVGPSGSGKTTLLRLLAGFDIPDAGSIILDGETLADGERNVPAHRRGIGVVMQDGALFPHLTIGENIGFALPRGLERKDRIAGLIEMVGLDASMLQRKPDQLSGGQQQRVALARALAIKPRLILLDEPFSALDTGLRAATRSALAKLLSDAGVTTILVTHDQAEALSFSDQLAVMRGGRLEQVGTPRVLYLKPANPSVASFMGDAVILPAQIATGWATCSLGRIPVEDDQFEGRGQIMLRPEQIQLLDTGIGPSSKLGIVEAVEFLGAWSNVTIRLVSAPLDTQPVLSLRQTGIGPFPVGSAVSATITGTAHRFAP